MGIIITLICAIIIVVVGIISVLDCKIKKIFSNAVDLAVNGGDEYSTEDK